MELSRHGGGDDGEENKGEEDVSVKVHPTLEEGLWQEESKQQTLNGPPAYIKQVKRGD